MNIDLSPIFHNGRVRCGALKQKWFTKNGLGDLFYEIHIQTRFLDLKSPSMRERIFYIQNGLAEIQICPHCNKNHLNFDACGIKLRKRCSSLECKRKLTSITTKENQKNMSESDKIQKSNRISIALSGRRLSDSHKNKMRGRFLGTTQTTETIQKRIASRKSNGKAWHREDTKLKISESNKKTHGTVESKNEKKLRYDPEQRLRQSNLMKEKILNGEFTPCITNSWTKWKAFVNWNGSIKKFRSNWEAAFWVLNSELEYEKIRIPYQFNHEYKIYIVDFCDTINKILYEIKPASEIHVEKNITKVHAAEEWCKSNGWIFKIISNDWFARNAYKINFTKQPQLTKSMKQFL